MNSRLVSLFPTPLYSCELPVTDLHKQLVRKLKYSRLGGVCNISDNKFVLDTTEFADLKRMVDIEVQEFGKNIFSPNDDVKFVLKNSWIMENLPGDYNSSHFHVNSLISGILYIDVNEKSGNIIFHKNINNLHAGMLDLGVINYNIFNSSDFTITPVEGQLLIFPSTLFHRASINESDKTRYCIAFNYFITGTLNKDGPEELTIL